MKKTTVNILALISCILWASIFPVLKILYPLLDLSHGISSKMTLAGMRFTLAGVLILAYYGISTKQLPVPKKDQLPTLSLIGIFQTTLLYATFYVSMTNVTGIKSSVISQSGIFIIIILAYIFLDERIKKNQWFGILLGVIGILVININQLSTDTTLLNFTLQGEGLLLLSGVFGSIGQILAKIKNKGYHPMFLNGWQMTIGGTILLVVGTTLNNGLVPLTTPLSVILFLHTVMVAAVGFTIWYTLLKHVDISSIVSYRLTIPVLGSAFSALFIPNENLSLYIIAGLALVVFGMYISGRTKRSE